MFQSSESEANSLAGLSNDFPERCDINKESDCW